MDMIRKNRVVDSLGKSAEMRFSDLFFFFLCVFDGSGIDGHILIIFFFSRILHFSFF
jgi:hypothetical protein